MTKASTTTTAPTITRNDSEVFIPLNKLKKSPRNARKTPHSEAAIEAKAASIAAKGILQNLVVEPELDDAGVETGFFLVTIGEGRRLAQLLRVKRKQIKKTEPIRCVIDTVNDAQEISLDENVTREAMHPADQFEAFHELAERKGWGAEAIAARFGVSAHVVRQRLRLSAASPRLMQLYRNDELTLDALMAFVIVDDHARQEEVYDNLSSWDRDAATIRRTLMQAHVKATDRRAVFIGTDAYREAGGAILRDLFTEDGGGFYEDAALLDRLVMAKLETVAATIRQEGWKWVDLHINYPHAHGMSRSRPQVVELSAEDEAAYAAVQATCEALTEQHADADELPDEVQQQMTVLEAELERIDARRRVYAAADIAQSGAMLSLSHDGTVRIERGFIRADDETPEPEEDDTAENDTGAEGQVASDSDGMALPASLVRDLTAHKTVGLRLALGQQPDIALVAVTHALAVQAFYIRTGESCLELRSGSTELGTYAPGINDSAAAKKLAERHEAWAAEMPQDAVDLWDFVAALGEEDRMALLAHCASLTVNAVKQPGQSPRTQAAVNKLASAVGLDMAEHWSPKTNAYLERVPKAHILAAVREGVSDRAAKRLAGLKKGAMAEAAGELLAGTRWLPALLKTSVHPEDTAESAVAA